MRKIKASKKNKKQSKKEINKRKKIQARKAISMPVKKRWVLRKKTFSPYPYIITISNYRTNVFFTAADIRGQTKTWTSTGRSKFTNKDKTTYMAVIRVTEIFYKKLRNLGIRRVLFRFKNVYKKNTRLAVRRGIRKMKRSISLKYIGFFVKTQISFNGCRKKKKRRR